MSTDGSKKTVSNLTLPNGKKGIFDMEGNYIEGDVHRTPTRICATGLVARLLPEEEDMDASFPPGTPREYRDAIASGAPGRNARSLGRLCG